MFREWLGKLRDMLRKTHIYAVRIFPRFLLSGHEKKRELEPSLETVSWRLRL